VGELERRLLSLQEYERRAAVALSTVERDALIQLGCLTLTPTVEQDGYYDITAGSQIGALVLPTLDVLIRPKLPIQRVLFLLSSALDPKTWREPWFTYAPERSLVEAIIYGFIAQVRRAVHRGVLQGYRTEETAILTVRGRIRLDDQIRRHYGRVPPIEVRYDEYTDDIEENRLLKAALTRLGRLNLRSETISLALRSWKSLFANVAAIEYDPRHLPEIVYTRLNEHYRPALTLAKLILRSTSYDLHHGRISSSSFLVDMNDVFENFVVVALREALRLSEREFPQGAASRSLYLDYGRRIKLEPDVSWWEGPTCRFVGDVKYKRLAVSGVLHPDVYQLLAYSIATNLPGGLLIYAAGEGEAAQHHIVYLDKKLEITTLDLSGEPPSILEQIDQIALRIHKKC
jgi:5-methylcytosine-specific restriction enzyme subunit McrC